MKPKSHSQSPECIYHAYCGNDAPEGIGRYNYECDDCLDAVRDHCKPGTWNSRDEFVADFYGKEIVERPEAVEVRDPRRDVLRTVSDRYRYVLWCPRCEDVDSYVRNSKTVRAGRAGRLGCTCGGTYELIRSNPPSYVNIE